MLCCLYCDNTYVLFDISMEIPQCDNNELFGAELLEFRTNYEKALIQEGKLNVLGFKGGLWNKAKIKQILQHFKSKSTSDEKRELFWRSKYDYITVDGQDHLIYKKKKPNDPTIRIIPQEEYFDCLYHIHTTTGHNGHEKTSQYIKDKFFIPLKPIKIFCMLCPRCSQKAAHKKNDTLRPKISCSWLMTEVDIIDFRYCPDGEFNWLLKYEDHDTKFLCLRPLKSKNIEEIAMELIKLFFSFGPPSTLHSAIGDDFLRDILKEIRLLWPSCEIMNAPSKLSKLINEPSRLEVNNIVEMLRTWMRETNSQNWSVGCFLVQYRINGSQIEIGGKSAYETVFKRDLSYRNVSLKTKSNNITKFIQMSKKKTSTRSSSLRKKCANHSATIICGEMPEPSSVMLVNDQQENITENHSLGESNSKTETASHKRSPEFNNAFDFELEIKYTQIDKTLGYVKSDGVSNLKTEPLEIKNFPKNKCDVCECTLIPEDTVSCFDCKTKIHKTCGFDITNKGCDVKVFCFVCFGKPVTENEIDKAAVKGGKRELDDTDDNNTAKRVPPSAGLCR